MKILLNIFFINEDYSCDTIFSHNMLFCQLSLKLSFIKCGVGGKSTEGAEDSMPKLKSFRVSIYSK